MAIALKPHGAPEIWCGRSWEALVERRVQMFEQALALRRASDVQLPSVVTSFLGFFQETGLGLLRDEEEWIFRSLTPTPQVVLRALEEHIAISTLMQVLLREAEAGCADLRVVHKLGGLIEDHLLMEEEEIRPLVTAPRLAPVN